MSVGLGVTPSSCRSDLPSDLRRARREGARAGAGEDAEAGFVPPTYPFDKLAALAELAQRHEGGAVDLSIGTPCDPPPALVLEALATSGSERGYPSSIGTSEYREAALAWMSRRFGVDTAGVAIAACVGTKELVAGVPHWLRLRTPARDTVLCPLVAYPTYEMGAILARCRAVAVPTRPDGTMQLSSISPEDAARPCACGSTARQPRRPARGPGGRGEVGSLSWRAGVLRRVLHRVHLGRARPHGPRARPRGGHCRPLAIETVESRRATGRFLCRGRRSCRVPVQIASARRVHGAGTRAARRRRGARR